jgi:hypothetical protein
MYLVEFLSSVECVNWLAGDTVTFSITLIYLVSWFVFLVDLRPSIREIGYQDLYVGRVMVFCHSQPVSPEQPPAGDIFVGTVGLFIKACPSNGA